MVSRQMVEDQHYDPVIYWYRYEDYYGEDAYEPCIQIARFRVIKKTPKGVWLNHWGGHRWVSNESRKRLAYPTKELAYESFLARKCAHMKHVMGAKAHLDHILRLAREQKDELLEKGRVYQEIPTL